MVGNGDGLVDIEMDVTGDTIAGVVDLFGALTEDELRTALAELAYKRGDGFEPERFEQDIADACESYHLVRVTDRQPPFLVPGPVAFPTVPEGGTDLVHILDVETRDLDRSVSSTAAVERFDGDVRRALEENDRQRLEDLLDVSYELEAWASVDLSDERDRLEEARR